MNNITSAVGLNTKSQTDQKEAVTVFLLACTYTQIQEICNKQSTERKYQLFLVDNFSFKKCHETPPHRAANFTCRKTAENSDRKITKFAYFFGLCHGLITSSGWINTFPRVKLVSLCCYQQLAFFSFGMRSFQRQSWHD